MGKRRRKKAKSAYDCFVHNVRVQLDVQDLMQQDLAKKLGTSPGYVTQVLNGHRMPRITTLEKIAKALGITTSALLEDR